MKQGIRLAKESIQRWFYELSNEVVGATRGAIMYGSLR
jgi:hypothetical protein